jgi:hypothetical protein
MEVSLSRKSRFRGAKCTTLRVRCADSTGLSINHPALAAVSLQIDYAYAIAVHIQDVELPTCQREG